MAIPDFQSLMLPILKALADGQEQPISQVRERVAAAEELSAKDLQEGTQGVGKRSSRTA